MRNSRHSRVGSTLLIGFDSAWSLKNRGAIVAIVIAENGAIHGLGPPRVANFSEAAEAIAQWRSDTQTKKTIILLDQPSIVDNDIGQRPVENLASSAVSLRYGGMQPASKSRDEMFGPQAPVWSFLDRFGGPADPMKPEGDLLVFETYPVLTMIALGWTLPDLRPTGRLPKYNPLRRKTFSTEDWRHVCERLSDEFAKRGVVCLDAWIQLLQPLASPKKVDQDRVDACVCLVVALHLIGGRDCLMVGDTSTGYIVVPFCAKLQAELETRCNVTGRAPGQWVRRFKLDLLK